MKYEKLITDIMRLAYNNNSDKREELLEQIERDLPDELPKATQESIIKELNKKVIEEANEFAEENSIEELGDLMEVINAIMKLKGYKMEDVNIAMKKKVDKKGCFNDRIYLEYVDEKSRNLEEEKELNKDFRK